MHPSPLGPSAAVRSQQQPYGEFRQSGSAEARALTPERYQKYYVSDFNSNPSVQFLYFVLTIPACHILYRLFSFPFPFHLYQATKRYVFYLATSQAKILVIRSSRPQSHLRARRWAVSSRREKSHINRKNIINSYCRLHSFSGTCLSLVHCRLFLWLIVKFFACSSLGSGLHILVRECNDDYSVTRDSCFPE